MRSLLQNVEMSVSVEGDSLTVTAPFWRTDIETREDVVEEVGRLYGFDKLPLELPMRVIKPVAKNGLLELKGLLRKTLARAGANEVLTYSFVHGDLMQKTGQDQAKAFRISNALSPDLQYYRLSLTPSLLDKVHMNIKAGYDKFALFEIGKGHNLHQTDEDGLPTEFEMLDVVYAANDKAAEPGAAYYQALAMLKAIEYKLGTSLELRPFTAEEDYEVAKPYDHSRSAKIFVAGTDIGLGMIGEYKASVRRAFKLPQHSAGFGLGLTQLQSAVLRDNTTYATLSRFPSVSQDLTIRVAVDMAFAELYKFVDTELGANAPDDTHIELKAVGVYQGKDDLAHKNVTFRIVITAENRTLTEQEVTKVVDAIAAAAHEQLGARRV
jgi:phenylalanyl-tRNA synthetase beta chain